MNILYIRVSKEDEDKQDPQQQIDAIIEKYEITEYKIYMERGSAYDLSKIHKRHEFFKILELCFNSGKITINDLFLSKLEKKDIKLYVWDYARIIRNIELNILFSLLSEWFGVKIISYKDRSIIKESISKTPTEKMVKLMMNTISAFSAEEYSYTTSENIKKAVVKGVTTRSKDGKKWGRKFTNLEGVKVDLGDDILERMFKDMDSIIRWHKARGIITYYNKVIKMCADKYNIKIGKDYVSRRQKRID